jgi:site-specific DNA recombinase
MKKAYIYVRVSTDEQAEKGYSQRHQEERLRQYCQLQNIEIVGFFKEDHSAKTFERPAFKQMLALMKKNRGKANLLLFLKWDRFSRNAGDAYGMISQLNRLGIEPQGIEQPLDLSVPENKMMLAFYLAAPEVENDRRSLNVIAGMRRSMAEGRYVTGAPKGYKNTRNEMNRPIIVPAENAWVVTWVFEQLASGAYNVKEIWKQAKAKGLNVSKSNIWYLLRNPIYCGKILIPAYRTEEAKLVKGIHEPLVSEELFYTVQDVLDGRKRKVPSKNTAREEYPLRGYLQCRKCGGNLTASSSKGNGGMYYYYHCTTKCGERFKAALANDKFAEELAKISANRQSIELFRIIMSEQYKALNKDKAVSMKEINTEIAKQRQRITNMQELLADGKIDPADYREIKSRTETQLNSLILKQQQLELVEDNLGDYIETAAAVLNDLPEYYASADLAVKQKLIGLMFPEKLIFEKNAYQTIKPLEVINLICRTGGSSDGHKKKLASDNGSQSYGVIPLGLEPRTHTLKVYCSTN